MELKLLLGNLCCVRQLKQLLVGSLEQQLEVLHRRRVAVLQTDEQALLNDAELLRAIIQLLIQGTKLNATAQVLIDELKVLLREKRTALSSAGSC